MNAVAWGHQSMLTAAGLDHQDLPLPQRLALNYAPSGTRPATAALFTFDARLGELVAKASEPLLGQLRLAWWRDEMGKPVPERVKGDPVLDALGQSWAGEEAALVGLVDGWELLLGEALGESALEGFAASRAEAFGALARLLGAVPSAEAAARAGSVWALADFASRTSDPAERDGAVALALGYGRNPAPRARVLRPLAVLHGLALHSLAGGGAPLVSRRRDVIAAVRLGMFGR